MNLCMCAGLLGGVGLPFFNSLGTELLVVLILIFASASAGVFFLRETKKEEALKNMYTEIVGERNDRYKVEDQPDQINSSRRLKAPELAEEANNQVFESILNELGGVGGEEKLGTLFGSPRALKAKLNADFNA